MEAVGALASVVGIIAQARNVVDSVKNRIAIIQQAPGKFQNLNDDINRAKQHITKLEHHVLSLPTAICTSMRTLFDELLKSVGDILDHCSSTLDTLDGKVKSVLHRTVRANHISTTMNALLPEIEIASNKLLILFSTITTGQNIRELHDVVVHKLDNLRITGNVEEVYRVRASTPMLPLGTTLNFDAKDEDGKRCTPEGFLKESILSPDSSAVTVATGVITPAHGVLGMAGVGKTIALQGLAFNDDIRKRFPDGIQYMVLGQKATFVTARGEVAKIMHLTGASASVRPVEASKSLREAVDYAVAWFAGRICLFLVDDLWPTEDCETGFLGDLLQLIRCCSGSRMAITTRSTSIALLAGNTVDFAPRDALGPTSVNMFMMHATRCATKENLPKLTGELSRSIVPILKICGGLPIALAVAGRTVARLEKERKDFERACHEYARRLEKRRRDIGNVKGPEGNSLNAGLSLSLEVLEADFAELNTPTTVAGGHSICDLYSSLCVLRNQAWVPISVLKRMWKVDEDFALDVVRLLSGLSLCKLTFRENAEEYGLMLHDLQLEFCKGQAESMKTSSVWHTQLLNGYLAPEPSTSEESLIADEGGSFERMLLAQKPRPWWSVGDDGYILVELARHLKCAGMMMELGALLLDGRWTHARGKVGGMLVLKSDFDCFLTVGDAVISQRVRQGFELLWKEIQLSWGRVTEGHRPFLIQVWGRLLNLRTENAVVDGYLKSLESHTPKPYLRPVNAFFPDPCSAQIMEIPVGSYCWTVDCSPCGRFVASGAGWDVVVADASTGDILKRLKRHAHNVLCVSFTATSKKIVSGSMDKSIAVWEWETSESPVRILEGHSEWVRGVAMSSDGEKIFSCSDDCTLRIWEASTGAQIREFLQQRSVWCVAVSNDDQLVAMGLFDGTLKVVDSCTGTCIFEDADAHGNSINSVAFSGTGQRLVTGSRDYTIRVWDTGAWMSIGEPFEGHTNWVLCVRFSPDGRQIVSGSYDGTVRLWDASSGRYTWTSANVHSCVRSVAFTSDGGTIISGCRDGTIRIWDTLVEAEATEFEYRHSAGVRAVALSHDGLRIVSGSDNGMVCFWDSRTGNQIGGPMEGHTMGVRCVSFSHDGRQVVSGSKDNTVRLWDAESFNQIGNALQGHRHWVECVSFSSDGQRIVSGSRDRTVHIWDAKSGMQIGDALEGHSRFVWEVSESGDGLHVLSRDYIGVAIIWNLNKRNCVWKSGQVSRDSQDETSSEHGRDTKYEVTDKEAEEIIRSCGQQTPNVWPRSFPAYTGEAYCRNNSVYANVPAEDTLVGNLPCPVSCWQYNEAGKVFVGRLNSGMFAICNLIEEDE